jgi:glycosyltransferase involved in cell wall biosynthesis
MAEPEQTPRVSIVMPVYNGGAFLGEAVESLLGQTLGDFELVAVDDGSEDESAAVLEGFRRSDGRVRVVATEHRGVVAALNRGWQDARAEYVAIANADDLSLPERLARQATFLDENERVALVGSLVETIDNSGRRGRLLRFPTEPDAIRATLRHHNCLAQPSVMFRRSAVAAVGGYRLDYAEDYDLWLRLSERFDLANLREVLVLYRIHSGQISLSRIDEMERLRLAVRAAARARAAGLPDPLEGVNEITPAVLDFLRIGEREVARVVRAEWLSRAAILAEFDGAQARELLRGASHVVGLRAARSLEAARELLRADSCLAGGRPLRATAHVARAFLHEPLYTSSRLAAWLADRLRGPFSSLPRRGT